MISLQSIRERSKNIAMNRISINNNTCVSFVFDQEEVPCCVSASIVQLFYIQMCYHRWNRITPFLCSISYLYYNIRKLKGQTRQLSGANFYEAIHAIRMYGMIPESLFPYNKSQLFEHPPLECYDFAKCFRWNIRVVSVGQRWNLISHLLDMYGCMYCY